MMYQNTKIEKIIFTDYIMKTCPFNVYSLEPHFYVAKLGFAGVHLFFFFFFLLQNIDCEAVLTCNHNLCFEQKKYQNFSAENSQFLKLKNLCLFLGKVFIMNHHKNVLKSIDKYISKNKLVYSLHLHCALSSFW